MAEDLDCYILNDQPTSCGVCGTRTDFEDIDDTTQLHQCLNPECGYKFIAVDDELKGSVTTEDY